MELTAQGIKYFEQAHMYLDYMRHGNMDFDFALRRLEEILEISGLTLEELQTSEEKIMEWHREYHIRHAARHFQGMGVRTNDALLEYAAFQDHMTQGSLMPSDIGVDGEEYDAAMKRARMIEDRPYEYL